MNFEERLKEIAPDIKKYGPLSDTLGKLPDECVAALKKLGISRMMMPAKFGGLEAHPSDFFSILMKIAELDPAVGWVAGVVGVHPWEAALNSLKLQEELWRENPDTWIASPYSPMGVATPCDGGYILNGHWTFSSGTDFCEWAVLGALLGDHDGNISQPVTILHVMLPKEDYSIVDGSWNVVGLMGTGSKDVKVEEKYIPSYRVVNAETVMNPETMPLIHGHNPLFRMPWSAIFPSAITAIVLGICRGALEEAKKYILSRLQKHPGTKADPVILTALGEAYSTIDIATSRIIEQTNFIYNLTKDNRVISQAQRAAVRRDQVTGAWDSVRAINNIFNMCGAQAISTTMPLHRFWRDANAGLNHITFARNKIYQASALLEMGIHEDPDDIVRQALI